jgi:hypothetical protein
MFWDAICINLVPSLAIKAPETTTQFSCILMQISIRLSDS